MLKYYRVFAKQIKPLQPEPELLDFYQPSETQKNGELLFVGVGTGIATYVFKYPKVFQCDNGSEFTNEVTKLPEK